MEHLLEYQDYVLAQRLRLLMGGQLTPGPNLSLSAYAQKRLERQQLAQALIRTKDYHAGMRTLDALTDELNFGFWHNPNETTRVIRQVIHQGGCVALESAQAFSDALFTADEHDLSSVEERRFLAQYYLDLIQSSAAYLDAEIFTRLRDAVDALREQLPVVVLLSDRRVTL